METGYKKAYCVMLIYKVINSEVTMKYKVLNCLVIDERERVFDDVITKEYDIIAVDKVLDVIDQELLNHELTGYGSIRTVSEIYYDYDDASKKCIELNNVMNNNKKKVLTNRHFSY